MARIKLSRSYQGRRTNEQRIPAGVYDDNDPALMALGNYLVKNGHAVYDDATSVGVTPETVEPESVQEDVPEEIDETDESEMSTELIDVPIRGRKRKGQ
jgi:hypothetical protein